MDQAFAAFRLTPGLANPNTGWQAADVIGIDVGITLLSAENLRTGNVWKWFMANSETERAFDLAGIKQP